MTSPTARSKNCCAKRSPGSCDHCSVTAVIEALSSKSPAGLSATRLPTADANPNPASCRNTLSSAIAAGWRFLR